MIWRCSTQISELLTTPLMGALLMLRYKIDQSRPENAEAYVKHIEDRRSVFDF